jgi:uncharacterized protein involved in exopolysaccharide biosynthesis
MKVDAQTPVRIVDPTEAAEGDVSASPMTDSIPFLAVVNAILRSRLRIVLFVVVMCLGVLAYGLAKPREYVSDASFSLQGSDPQRLSGLAAQIGLAIPSNDGPQSPSYYMELLGSREILLATATSRYSVRQDGKVTNGTLPEVYGIHVPDSAIRYDRALSRLRGAISTNKSRETGIVKVTVMDRSPVLAQQILTRLIALLNDFNLKTRQSQAANERHFVEQRMTEIGGDLRGAEDRLESFLQRNRGSFASVPDLALEHDRLVRQVSLLQQVYTALSQNYEQARIDEVRDTPAITIIEAPNLPVYPAPRGLLTTLLLTLILTLGLSLLPPVVGVLMSSKRRSVEEEAAEFGRLKQNLLGWKPRHPSERFAAREAK